MTTTTQRMDALQVVGLVLLAGALLFVGVISVANQLAWQEPTDGVTWVQRGDRLVAEEVAAGGSGARAGIRAGDILLAIDGERQIGPQVVDEMLFARDVGERVEYLVASQGAESRVVLNVDGREPDNRLYYYMAFVGLAFLVVGVFALLRHPGAASQRFFWLALAFYALFALSPTTRASDPWYAAIYWLDQVGRDLAPALFLYFALTFPKPSEEIREYRTPLLLGAFGPGVAFIVLQVALNFGGPWIALSRSAADRIFQFASRAELIYFAAAIGLGVLALAHAYKSADTPTERKRLKWLVGGTTLGFLPLVAVYVPMQLLGLSSAPITNVAVLPLLLVPLSFGYAAVGFRLWDVEVMLKRGAVYAATSLTVLAVWVGVTWTLGRILAPGDTLVQTGSLIATLAVALMFAPLRQRFEELADRFYYRDRYRERRTLLDFGRELNSETDLAEVVESLVQKVRNTLGVGRVAVLLRVEETDHLRIVPPSGELRAGRPLSSNFSQFVAGALTKREFLYVDDLVDLMEEFPEDREILEAEDLAYFLPLEVKDDIIGVLAMGRKLSGDYLSSDDLKMLRPLAAHAALAVDNALLYREVERRAGELERLKTYSENIVESIKGGVIVIDEDGVVLSWNRSMEELYGRSADEVRGHRLAAVFPQGFMKVLDEALEKVQRGLEPLTSAYRIPLRTQLGHDRVVTLSLAPLLGDHGGRGTVVIVDDVTERTELESQLRQAEKLTSVGLLAAGVAHEVNTPLAGISSYVQMLQRKLPETDPRRAILEKIEKQTFRASQIVNNLLNFSRQETGDFRPVNLNEVVHETLSLAEIQLRKRRIQVETALAEQIAPIMGDPIKLQQVLMNLVLNARDAMPEGGSLHIGTAQQNGDAVLEVADTGTGIVPENVHKVYDPFFTTKGIGKGTGLGLSVSYGIIQEHRGSISVESEPDHGTRFRITLPVTHADAARAAS